MCSGGSIVQMHVRQVLEYEISAYWCTSSNVDDQRHLIIVMGMRSGKTTIPGYCRSINTKVTKYNVEKIMKKKGIGLIEIVL